MVTFAVTGANESAALKSIGAIVPPLATFRLRRSTARVTVKPAAGFVSENDARVASRSRGPAGMLFSVKFDPVAPLTVATAPPSVIVAWSVAPSPTTEPVAVLPPAVTWQSEAPYVVSSAGEP